MYPYELIPGTGIDLYSILIVVGVIAAFVTLRFLSDKTKIPAKVFNFAMLTSIVAIVVGWLAAMLFQAVYNFTATGEFVFKGQTFLGGLIGGAAVFLLFYFIVGKFVFKGSDAHIKNFGTLLNILIPCLVVAHGFGRIGCLTAGCCYGEVTDAWYGVHMHSGGVWADRVPTQLFEALFLFALFAVLLVLVIKVKMKNTLSVYLIAYGVWRFFIEFVRADNERGASIIKGLYPSQLISVIMVVAGVAWAVVYAKVVKPAMEKRAAASQAAESEEKDEKSAYSTENAQKDA